LSPADGTHAIAAAGETLVALIQGRGFAFAVTTSDSHTVYTTGRLRSRVERADAVCQRLGGLVAVARATGTPLDAGAAVRAVVELAGDRDAGFLGRALRHAEAIVERAWPALGSFAAVLAERGELDAADVQRLLGVSGDELRALRG
jgi:hypothetical protein